MTDLRNLKVLDASLQLVDTVHAAAAHLDVQRVPRLRNQLLRATDAVPANIAEGARGSRPEFVQFLRIALRSADEAGAHLMVARRVQALPLDQFRRCESKRVAVCKMLHGLIRAVEEYHAREQNTEQQQR
ncbi:four helix bundle protein [Gemmatimonas sp.]|uniref:four helix bundle protein n=1 Tax=Gemmatimonas sp. TaxID=1962908 RepID=UPI0031BE1884|nr:four helix bundle protein [Gemmatimonas sp.]